MIKKRLAIIALALVSASLTAKEPYKFDPPGYVCYRAPMAVVVDGDIDGEEWNKTPWTSDFIDIEGDNKPVKPRYRCRAKLMWDDTYLYIAAELEEPHLWATLTERESVIFNDNDFEIFFDVTGSTHHYVEYEVNALGTEWDLMLTKPYRDNGAPLNAWNLNGIKSAVKLYGTLNDPSDRDERWTLEMAIPLATLKEVTPGRKKVQNGESWRLNFSRVQWQLDVVDGKYVKWPGLREDNWVWAPTGKINIHEPEYWGFLQFSDVTAGKTVVPFAMDRNEEVKWALRKLYYRQQEFMRAHGRWATTPGDLQAGTIMVNGLPGWTPEIVIGGDWFMMSANGYNNTKWYITSDGFVGQDRWTGSLPALPK